ncbi:MAG: hypothetical protein RMJ17_02970 [Candidatus Aenigmarchaeota archaeon]|nr:hypothetical protein [Candidatus Aenigmarchaeota archaeon]MDW8149529.1 hypothetical protein [Candidatus Aenigmarchaeota archaeon]
MKSKILEQMIKDRIEITKDCEYFTKRENFLIVKFKNENEFKIEYFCEKCGNQEIKTVSKKPKLFSCSKCNKIFEVVPLRKK